MNSFDLFPQSIGPFQQQQVLSRRHALQSLLRTAGCFAVASTVPSLFTGCGAPAALAEEFVGGVIGEVTSEIFREGVEWLLGQIADQVLDNIFEVGESTVADAEFHGSFADRFFIRTIPDVFRQLTKKIADREVHAAISQLVRVDGQKNVRLHTDLSTVEINLLKDAWAKGHALIPASYRAPPLKVNGQPVPLKQSEIAALERDHNGTGPFTADYCRRFSDGRHEYLGVVAHGADNRRYCLVNLSVCIENDTSPSLPAAVTSQEADDTKYPSANAAIGSTIAGTWHNTSGDDRILYIDGNRVVVRNGDTVTFTGIVIYNNRNMCKVLKVEGEDAFGNKSPLYFPLSKPTDRSFFDCTPVE